MAKWIVLLLAALLGPLVWAAEPNYDVPYRPQFHSRSQGVLVRATPAVDHGPGAGGGAEGFPVLSGGKRADVRWRRKKRGTSAERIVRVTDAKCCPGRSFSPRRPKRPGATRVRKGRVRPRYHG